MHTAVFKRFRENLHFMMHFCESGIELHRLIVVYTLVWPRLCVSLHDVCDFTQYVQFVTHLSIINTIHAVLGVICLQN